MFAQRHDLDPFAERLEPLQVLWLEWLIGQAAEVDPHSSREPLEDMEHPDPIPLIGRIGKAVRQKEDFGPLGNGHENPFESRPQHIMLLRTPRAMPGRSRKSSHRL